MFLFLSNPDLIYIWSMPSIQIIVQQGSFKNKVSNPSGAGGGADSARPFFKRPFLHEKMVLEVSDFLTFPNSLLTFRI